MYSHLLSAPLSRTVRFPLINNWSISLLNIYFSLLPVLWIRIRIRRIHKLRPPGLGSVIFCKDLRIWIRIRIRPSIIKQKKLKYNHDFYCFVTSFSLKTDVNVPSKVIRRKLRGKHLFFWHLKSYGTDEFQTKRAESGIRTKCHGSATLLITLTLPSTSKGQAAVHSPVITVSSGLFLPPATPAAVHSPVMSVCSVLLLSIAWSSMLGFLSPFTNLPCCCTLTCNDCLLCPAPLYGMELHVWFPLPLYQLTMLLYTYL